MVWQDRGWVWWSSDDPSYAGGHDHIGSGRGVILNEPVAPEMKAEVGTCKNGSPASFFSVW